MENNSIQTSNITELFSLKHGIEIKDAEELLSVMEEVHYRKGEILMHEGEVLLIFLHHKRRPLERFLHERRQ